MADAAPDELVVRVRHRHENQRVEALIVEEFTSTITRLLALEVLTVGAANAMWQIPAQSELVGDL